MTRLMLAGAMTVLLLAACSDPTATQKSWTMRFTLDAATCRGAPRNLQFFIDGKSVGSGPGMIGGQSKEFSVTLGSHFASARDDTGSWAAEKFDVNGGETAKYLLTC